MRRLNSSTITTQPSNGATSKISSWWRQIEEEEGGTIAQTNLQSPSCAQIITTKTTACITTNAGRDDVETAYHDNNNNNSTVRRTQQEQPYIMSNHLRTSSSRKQRGSDIKHGIATSIVAGLILLFSVSMFLVYIIHINISIDTPNKSIDTLTAVNLATRKSNRSNKYVKEKERGPSSSSASLVSLP